MRSYIIGLAAASLLPSLSLSLSPEVSPNPSSLFNLRSRELIPEPDMEECMRDVTGNKADKDAECYEYFDATTQCMFNKPGDTEFTADDLQQVPPEEEQKCTCDDRRDQFWVGWQKCSDCFKENDAPEGVWLGPDLMSSLSDAYCSGTPTQGLQDYASEYIDSIVSTASATLTSGWTEGTAEPMSSEGLAAAMPTGIDHGLVGAAGVVVAAMFL